MRLPRRRLDRAAAPWSQSGHEDAGAFWEERDGWISRATGGPRGAMTQIVIDKVRHMYRPARGRPVLALEDVSLEINEQEFLNIMKQTSIY